VERDVYLSMRSMQREHWWFLARRKILARLIAGLRLRPGARILEAGSGSGGNIPLLQTFGAVSAFDMDAQVASFCELDTGVHCLVGSLPDDNPFRGSKDFDLVVALDVLEHIDDDVASLVSLASCVGPDGRLLLMVPAYQWMFSSHDVIHHHKRRYTIGRLRAAVEAAGFKVVRSGYFNSLLFPVVAGVRLGGKIAGRDSGSDLKMPGRWLNAALARIFGSESTILGRVGFPFGTSIFLIAAKSGHD
jgi:SAM-dependent methyltransferase